MKLGEETGTSSEAPRGQVPSYNQFYSSGSAAVSNNLSETEKEAYTFSEVVDKACNELMEKQCKYSIRKINEMEEILTVMECELDEFLKLKC